MFSKENLAADFQMMLSIEFWLVLGLIVAIGYALYFWNQTQKLKNTNIELEEIAYGFKDQVSEWENSQNKYN